MIKRSKFSVLRKFPDSVRILSPVTGGGVETLVFVNLKVSLPPEWTCTLAKFLANGKAVLTFLFLINFVIISVGVSHIHAAHLPLLSK